MFPGNTLPIRSKAYDLIIILEYQSVIVVSTGHKIHTSGLTEIAYESKSWCTSLRSINPFWTELILSPLSGVIEIHLPKSLSIQYCSYARGKIWAVSKPPQKPYLLSIASSPVITHRPSRERTASRKASMRVPVPIDNVRSNGVSLLISKEPDYKLEIEKTRQQRLTCRMDVIIAWLKRSVISYQSSIDFIS